MKSIRYSWLIAICAFILISCKKDPLTRRVEFNSTTYKTLGTFDNNGKPIDYLESPDAVSQSLFDFIHSSLPEREDLRKNHPEWLSNPAIADIKIEGQPSNVYVTYVSEHTQYANTFAFYTYPSGTSPATTEDIDTITYVFPNVGGNTTLNPGDKVKIGTFNPGTSIGFVLMKNAWKSPNTINNKSVHFCSNDALNPEIDVNLKKHAVLLKYEPENKVIVGFEDLDRTESECDHDFNDFVIYYTITPQ